MMKIESVQVIPSRKDSMFEETPLQTFEVAMITTSYDEWRPVCDKILGHSLEASNKIDGPPEFDDVCVNFARSHKAFMCAPTAIFHDTVYIAKSVVASSVEQLAAISNSGPLYVVMKHRVDDRDAGKIVERMYIDDASFMPMYGMWYPHKTVYRVRFGVKMNDQ